MNPQENISWMPLPRYIKKEVLSTMNKHVMHAANISASTRNKGWLLQLRYISKEMLSTMNKHVEATGDNAKCTLQDRHPTITKTHRLKVIVWQVVGNFHSHLSNFHS